MMSNQQGGGKGRAGAKQVGRAASASGLSAAFAACASGLPAAARTAGLRSRAPKHAASAPPPPAPPMPAPTAAPSFEINAEVSCQVQP